MAASAPWGDNAAGDKLGTKTRDGQCPRSTTVASFYGDVNVDRMLLPRATCYHDWFINHNQVYNLNSFTQPVPQPQLVL